MVPMENVVLTDAVGKEVKVARSTFIRGDRLARVRKQLGLGATVAEIKKYIRRLSNRCRMDLRPPAQPPDDGDLRGTLLSRSSCLSPLMS